MRIKVFKMNHCDWMAAESLKQAKVAYLQDFSGDLPGDEALDNPRVLTHAEMLRLQFHDEDGTERSFGAQLDLMIARGESFPNFFASTEY